MDLETLKAIFQAVDIRVVHVEGEAMYSEDKRPTVIGTLDDYVAALKALRAPIVLVYTSTLESDEFLYDPETHTDADDDYETDDTQPLDLCSENPAMAEFKPHIGEIGEFRLSAPMQSERLEYSIREEWYGAYMRCWMEAVEQINARRALNLAEADEKADARITALLASMHTLTEDKKFARLPTQKAMLAYALQKMPDLDEIHRSDLKEEIQHIHAKIVARGGDDD